jgi:hypothetical protein
MRSMNLKRAGTALAVVALVLAAGCATAGQGAESGTPAPKAEPRLHVQNNNWDDVTVYALSDGWSTRLGNVMAGDSAVFALPNSVLRAANAHFLVLPLASNMTYISPTILWNRDMILWISSELRQSTLVPLRKAG